ncbi:MAG TPA: DUF2269 family protein [Actinomycetota bacterium]|nr:DUF2269 family protein [Actinomycetota bacterium]
MRPVLGLTLYAFLKFLHVLLAIVAVGFNASYALWLARGDREHAHTAFALRGVKLLDDRIANPAYALLLVTGISMVIVGDLDLTTFWIATALGLYLVAVVLGLLVYTPTLRRQIQLVESDGPSSPAYAALARRGTVVGIVLAVDVIVIVFLMVTKPTW